MFVYFLVSLSTLEKLETHKMVSWLLYFLAHFFFKLEKSHLTIQMKLPDAKLGPCWMSSSVSKKKLLLTIYTDSRNRAMLFNAHTLYHSRKSVFFQHVKAH